MTKYSTNDPANMAQSIWDFPENIVDALKIEPSVPLEIGDKEFKNILIAGMGGSAIGGDVVNALAGDQIQIPLVVSRHYELPTWVDENSLVICSSYSGNTEETLFAFEDAKEKGASILGITTGGKLLSKLQEGEYPYLVIPSGLQPRAAMAFSFVPMLNVLNRLNLIDHSVLDELAGVVSLLSEKRLKYSSQDGDNPTLKLSENIVDKLPVIYGQSTTTGIAAMRWKGQICENAKMLAFHNELPELNHNEIVGWENNPSVINQIALIWLKDIQDNERVRYRQTFTGDILKNIAALQETVSVEGKTFTERFLHLIYFGDWVSFWCAVIHGTDPSPVFKIENLKKELAQV